MNASDRRIEAEAEKRMERSLIPDLGGVACNFRHGILTLYGVVSSVDDRYVAQELIADIEGIEIIDNQLAVATKKVSPVFVSQTTRNDAGRPGLEESGKIPGESQKEAVLPSAKGGKPRMEVVHS
jgi:hypothetical protein